MLKINSLVTLEMSQGHQNKYKSVKLTGSYHHVKTESEIV